MPWRLGGAGVPGLNEDDGGSYDALHALGVDAYRLARRWWQLRSDAAPRVSSLTADLHSTGDGILLRKLTPAEFARGVLQSP
jgi:outer membrane PBP1 activator LpoA protein